MVEVLVTMAIASISLAAIYNVFGSAQKLNTSNEVTARVMQDIRLGLDLMESDIRLAGLRNPLLNDSLYAGIEEATETKLRFTADRNMDGGIYENSDGISLAIDLNNGVQEQDIERITYFYDEPNKRLMQCLSEGTANESCEPVAEDVENTDENKFSFSYFDENNVATADITLIRIVEVTMTIRQPAGKAGYLSRTMTRRIFCRNLVL